MAAIAAEIVTVIRNQRITGFTAVIALHSGFDRLLSFFRWRFNKGHSGRKTSKDPQHRR
jgi:hypothetical protein